MWTDFDIWKVSVALLPKQFVILCKVICCGTPVQAMLPPSHLPKPHHKCNPPSRTPPTQRILFIPVPPSQLPTPQQAPANLRSTPSLGLRRPALPCPALLDHPPPRAFLPLQEHEGPGWDEAKELKEAHHKFKLLDTDADGDLGVDELGPAFHELHPPESRYAALESDRMMALADQDGDGHLSLDEMLASIKAFYGEVRQFTGHDEF
jgi:hypothetical protein